MHQTKGLLILLDPFLALRRAGLLKEDTLAHIALTMSLWFHKPKGYVILPSLPSHLPPPALMRQLTTHTCVEFASRHRIPHTRCRAIRDPSLPSACVNMTLTLLHHEFFRYRQDTERRRERRKTLVPQLTSRYTSSCRTPCRPQRVETSCNACAIEEICLIVLAHAVRFTLIGIIMHSISRWNEYSVSPLGFVGSRV